MLTEREKKIKKTFFLFGVENNKENKKQKINSFESKRNLKF